MTNDQSPISPFPLTAKIPTDEPPLCTSQFKVRVYQDLGEGAAPLELPALTNAIFEYEIDDGSDVFSDEYFPDTRIHFLDEDGDSLTDEDEEDEDLEDEDDLEDVQFQVTVSYSVTPSVLKEIRGAFPLPPDANLVFEITHTHANGVACFRHTFRGWPHHNSSCVASNREPEEMVNSISLQCEDTTMFQML